MTTRDDSYGSATEVLAFTRHLMDGQSTFNSTTRPTGTEVDKFIDRASGALNVALNNAGITTPVTNTTAKLILDDWVVNIATEYVELTQRGVGYSEAEGSRHAGFKNLHKAAYEFVNDNALGMKRLGVSVGTQLNQGLAFTGLDAQDDRTDPDDTSLEQPLFTRRLFDNKNEDKSS